MMKNYIKNIANNPSINLTVDEVEIKDIEIAEKINQNVQRGALISRVISKNPHLLRIKRKQ